MSRTADFNDELRAGRRQTNPPERRDNASLVRGVAGLTSAEVCASTPTPPPRSSSVRSAVSDGVSPMNVFQLSADSGSVFRRPRATSSAHSFAPVRELRPPTGHRWLRQPSHDQMTDGGRLR